MAHVSQRTASATVGTVEVRSLAEPWRKIIARVKGHFIASTACGIEMDDQLLEIDGQDGGENFYLPVSCSLD
jgi:NADH dehydrogenase